MKFLALIEKNQNAIIGALIIHVLVFVWLNIQNISFYVIQPKEKTIATFDFTEITKQINNIDDKGNEPIAPIKLTNAASNYDQNQELSASQKQQLEQQIINEVKNYEQSQFQELGEDNPILKSKNFLESKKNQEDDILYKSLAKSSSAT